MIEIRLIGPQNIKSLTLLPEALKNQLFRGMQDGALLIEQTSKTKYLSGPYPIKLAVDERLLRQGVWAYAGLSGEAGEFGRIIAKSQRWYGIVHEQKGIPGDQKVIWAKSSKGMHFFWMRRNIWVRGAMRVIIPARPFLLPAVIDNLEKIKNLLNRTIRQAYRQVGGKGNP